MLSALTGNFRKMFLFTILIFIHELGHYLTAYFFKWKVNRIVLYPYGGCSYFEVDVNTSNLQEFFVLIMGPIFQIFFTYLMSFFLREIDYHFLFSASKILLIFNLFPIYPLDGGKLLFIVFNLIFPYFISLKITFYSSLIFYFFILILSLTRMNSIFWFLLLLSLFFRFWEEQKKGYYLYQKFLLERYMNEYQFQKNKIITSPYSMKKGYHHTFVVKKELIPEKEYLSKYFSLLNMS